MGQGDPGQGEFRNAVMELRNRDIVAGLAPLMTMREEITTNDDLRDRGGFDTTTRDHFLQLLLRTDRLRRHVTYFRGDADANGNSQGTQADDTTALEKLIRDAISTQIDLGDETTPNPFSGDEIQMGSGSSFQLPWDLSGVDENIPLAEKIRFSNNGLLLLGEVNAGVVTWTRMNSRHRTARITRSDSLRAWTHYKRLYEFLMRFGGDGNRTDVAQLRATEEPRGPENAPNRKTETPGESTRGN